MKSLPLNLVLATLLCSSSALLAADKPAAPKPLKHSKTERQKKPKTDTLTEQSALTGSYIKKEVHRSGVVTDGPDPVFVIDSNAIRNSGASNVRELLAFRGLGH